MAITTGRFNPATIRGRIIDNNWPDNADDIDGTLIIAPTSISFSGTSASANGNGFVEFESVSELSLNGIFSSSYEDYIIILNCFASSGTPQIYYRLMAGVNVAATNYYRQYLYANDTSVASARSTGQSVGFIGHVDSGTNETSATTVYFYRPYLESQTYSKSQCTSQNNTINIMNDVCVHRTSQSNTGLYIFPSTGLITGQVSVLGVVS